MEKGRLIKETDIGRVIYSDIFFTHGIRQRTWLDYLFNSKGMANLYSDEFTKVRAGRRVAPSIFGGKTRIIKWDFASLPAGAIGDILTLGKIYKDDMVVLGREFHSALTSGASTATGAYGTYTIKTDGLTPNAVDDVDRFLVATSFEAAGEAFIAETLTHNALFTATVDLILACTNSVELFATAGRAAGWLLVVRD